jgi:uncharacterized NAD(P)/FAD-binding protein YdhS
MNAIFAPGSGRVIAIIGGGFSGTVLASYLLHGCTTGRLRIVLVERRDQVGCGVAYAQTSFPYLLNVPAGRMSVLAEDSTDFVRFSQQRLPNVTKDAFLPRHIYGEYLRETLLAAQSSASPEVYLERLQGETRYVHAVDTHGPLIVSVGARQLLADQVVLACGDPGPVAKPYASDVVGHPAYIVDPYREFIGRPTDRALLLIGAGLTMADVAIAAAARNPELRIIALSRHGLLPMRQSEGMATVLPPSLQLSHLPGLPLRGVVRQVRAWLRGVQEQGGDWREAITRLRELVPQLWRAMGESDRRRFLRHVRTYWDVHRHRMAPDTADRIAELQHEGRLNVCAGSMVQLCADGDRIVALWRPRGRYETRELWVDRVIECSGPDGRLERSTESLWRQLLVDGIATVHPTGVGLRTGPHGALLDAHGRPSRRLFYLGPMLRATHWEATAVGELRVHARALAEELAATHRSASERRGLERDSLYGGKATGGAQAVDSAMG